VVGGAVGLAGRVGELRAVSELLGGGSDRAAMLIVGEAGVGKSRLVSAATDAVAEAGVLVVSGWCLPLAGGLPFLPVLDVLRVLGRVDNGRLLNDALAQCPAFVRAEVDRLRSNLEEPTGESGSGGSDDGWRKQRLFEALRQLLEALPLQRTVAVVVEDVHWADSTTLELLDYLFSPGHAGVPVVLTCRGEEAASETVSAWLDRLLRNPQVGRLDLAPLSEMETGEQIELLLGSRVSHRLVAETYARSEGNAFFTEQLVSARAAGEEHLLPAGLTALLLSRTGQVTGTARQILAVLAVAARPLDEATVVLLCQQPDRQVREALRDLQARRMLRRPDDAGRHQLRHALLGEAISGELLPSERAELHARIADTLAERDDPSLAAQIAEHLAAAGRSVDELRWRIRAGRHAEALFATADAAQHWQRAVALTAGAPTTQVVEAMSLAELYGAAQRALLLSGNFDAAQALAEEAFARLADAGPASRADVLARVGDFRGFSAPQEGLDLLYRALSIYEQLPPSPAHIKALRNLRGILLNEGRLAEATEVTERAAAVAELAGERTALLEILGEQVWDQMAAGAGQLAVDRMEALRQRLSERDEPRLHVLVATLHTDILLKLGRLTEVEAAGAPAIQIAEAYGIRAPTAAILRANVSAALTELGEVDTAMAWIEPVSDGTPDASTGPLYECRAMLEMLRGQLNEADQRWADLDCLPQAPLGFQVEGACEEAEGRLWMGAHGVAFEHLHALLVRVARANQGTLAGELLTFAGPLLVLALRACADLGEQGRVDRNPDAVHAAQRSADQLADLYHAMKPDPFTAGPMRPTAVADCASWQAEWSRVRAEPDPAAWEAAASEWDSLIRPHRAAYARWRQAEALLARPHGRTQATEALRNAARQAIQHVPLSDAIHDLARRGRIDLNPPSAAARAEHEAPPAFDLTDRELAVLKLLGQGKTNSEIGAALFISRKTASVHVTNILRKLGVGTRVQAAAVAERADLLQAD
jgi:DNA-binding CsgD family transcriptional regulator/tetratricopeptide (TPR) repeat protein